VIVDDCSDRRHQTTNEALARQFGWLYILNTERRGVARAKNRVLNQIRYCNHIFLFEDDAWPLKWGWDSWFLDLAAANDCQALNGAHPNGMAEAHIVGPCGNGLFEVANSTGYIMYWTREALEELGGYDARCGICGGEDTQMNLRCHRAGFKPAPYCGPAGIEDWFYSVDLDWIWGRDKREPPFGEIRRIEGSALTGKEKAKGWAAGTPFIHEPEIYREPEE